MDLKELLGKSFECECGRRHQAGVHRFIYEQGVMNRLGRVLKSYSKKRRLQIIADERTWQVAGKAAQQNLYNDGWDVKKVIVPDRNGHRPECDSQTLQELKSRLEPNCFLLATGSGVINDLTKWAAFEKDTSYAVIATAASMNGYAAANVAAFIDGVKKLVRARPPVVVIAEPGIIENTPFELTTAGFADAIAKSQSIADWWMNKFIFDEYICPLCSRLMNGPDEHFIEKPELLKARESKVISSLFKTLFYSGVAMTLAGSSAPASGGEHLLSHTLDMMARLDPDESGAELHGRQVGLGTIISAALYERLGKINYPQFVPMPEEIDKEFWGPISDAVAGEYSKKLEKFDTVRQRLSMPGDLQRLMYTLGPSLRKAGEVKQLLTRAGAPVSIRELGFSRQRVSRAMLHMHEIRARFTVVDLAWATGILPGGCDELIDQWLL
jgi:glycerol-1-phosphate dehydrogenase [NAD(P)+]